MQFPKIFEIYDDTPVAVKKKILSVMKSKTATLVKIIFFPVLNTKPRVRVTNFFLGKHWSDFMPESFPKEWQFCFK